MKPVDSLYQNLIPDMESYPEKLPATVERVQEVVDLVIKGKTMNLQAYLAAQGIVVDLREPLNPLPAKSIANYVAKAASQTEIGSILKLLKYSEISSAEAIALHENHKIPVSHLETDLIPIMGKGAWIFTNDGRSYLDMDSNYSATNLGNSNSQIARALYNQASQLISMKEDRVHIARSRFLKAFKGMLPEELNCFYWQNSGGEAVDKSLKIAKAYTVQTGVVAFTGSFHGRTHGAVAVTHALEYRQPFGLDNLDWVHFVDYNDAEAVSELFAQNKVKIVILELVQGEEAGIRPADRDFVSRLRQICDQKGGVLIFDEVQTGFGRCAEREGQWFACQNYGVIPDIITIGKSFGGGYPVTAVVTTQKISAAMQPGYDGSTFGGNPMAMVAAHIATQQMKRLNLTVNVVERSQQIKSGLTKLKEKYLSLGDVRIKGLFIGIDLPSVEAVHLFQKFLTQNGVMSSLSSKATVRFLPPLVITKADVDFLLKAVERSISQLERIFH